MSESILAWIPVIIEKVYMLAVIAFVALQFGWINRSTSSATPSESKNGETPQAAPQMNLAGLMQGMMSQMGPLMQQMTAPGIPTEAPQEPKQEATPTITQFE